MSSRPLALTLAGFAALGAAVLGAYLYDRSHRMREPERAVLAAALVPAATPAGPADGAVPSRRPEFSLPDLEGKVHPISEWDGKALVVNFWATWCAPCRREIPLLNKIQHEYAAKGFEVVGIAVDVPKDVKAYTATVPFDYPLLVGEQDGIDAAQAFGVSALAFPFTAFTDASGRLITLHLGELHEPTARAILDVIQRVDAGSLTATQARAEVRAAVSRLDRPPATTGS